MCVCACVQTAQTAQAQQPGPGIVGLGLPRRLPLPQEPHTLQRLLVPKFPLTVQTAQPAPCPRGGGSLPARGQGVTAEGQACGGTRVRGPTEAVRRREPHHSLKNAGKRMSSNGGPSL